MRALASAVGAPPGKSGTMILRGSDGCFRSVAIDVAVVDSPIDGGEFLAHPRFKMAQRDFALPLSTRKAWLTRVWALLRSFEAS